MISALGYSLHQDWQIRLKISSNKNRREPENVLYASTYTHYQEFPLTGTPASCTMDR